MNAVSDWQSKVSYSFISRKTRIGVDVDENIWNLCQILRKTHFYQFFVFYSSIGFTISIFESPTFKLFVIFGFLAACLVWSYGDLNPEGIIFVYDVAVDKVIKIYPHLVILYLRWINSRTYGFTKHGPLI
jgi:hypothetical protein